MKKVTGTYAYLVGIKVDASILASSLGNKRNALVQLAQGMVTAAAVGEDLDAVKPPLELGQLDELQNGKKKKKKKDCAAKGHFQP